MLEVIVHSELKKILRQGDWIHHLTMARMVARGIRLKRSTIIQTGINVSEYDTSYLIPVLLSSSPIIIITQEHRQKQLINEIIPKFQDLLNSKKNIATNINQQNKHDNFIYIFAVEKWLKLLENKLLNENFIYIVEEADILPEVIIQYFSQEITFQDCFDLCLSYPYHQEMIRDKLAKLTQSIYSHPSNPYESYLLEDEEINLILDIVRIVDNSNPLHQQFTNFILKLSDNNYIKYFVIDRKKGSFILKVSPLEIKPFIKNFWDNKPLILLSNYLEGNKYPLDYSQNLLLNLDNFTCLKFSSYPQNYTLNLYFPKLFPFPNNPDFKTKVIQEIYGLITNIKINHAPIIIIIDDMPLQAQVTANLASYFGSRVELNNLNFNPNTILVCNLKFWLNYQSKFSDSRLLIMPTLPIPSLENPLISAQVTHYKNQKKDWFRLYLLPSAIKLLQQATNSIRQNQGVLALFDNRVNYRTYGKTILRALEPYSKINYLDLDFINN